MECAPLYSQWSVNTYHPEEEMSTMHMMTSSDTQQTVGTLTPHASNRDSKKSIDRLNIPRLASAPVGNRSVSAFDEISKRLNHLPGPSFLTNRTVSSVHSQSGPSLNADNITLHSMNSVRTHASQASMSPIQLQASNNGTPFILEAVDKALSPSFPSTLHSGALPMLQKEQMSDDMRLPSTVLGRDNESDSNMTGTFQPNSKPNESTLIKVNPSDLVQKRVLFVSLIQLHRSYLNGIPAFILEHAIFAFGIKRCWLFPGSEAEKEEASQSYINHFRNSFSAEFLDMISNKDQKGMVLWIEPCSDAQTQACWNCINEKLCQIVDLSVSEEETLRNKQRLEDDLKRQLQLQLAANAETKAEEENEDEVYSRIPTDTTISPDDLPRMPSNPQSTLTASALTASLFTGNPSNTTSLGPYPSHRALSNHARSAHANGNGNENKNAAHTNGGAPAFVELPSSTETRESRDSFGSASGNTTTPHTSTGKLVPIMSRQEVVPHAVDRQLSIADTLLKIHHSSQDVLDQANQTVYIEDIESEEEEEDDDEDDEVHTDDDFEEDKADTLQAEADGPATDDAAKRVSEAKSEHTSTDESFDLVTPECTQRMSNVPPMAMSLNKSRTSKQNLLPDHDEQTAQQKLRNAIQYTFNQEKKMRITVDTSMANKVRNVKPEEYMPYYRQLRLEASWWVYRYEPCRKLQAQHHKRQLAQSAKISNMSVPLPFMGRALTDDIKSQFNVEADEVLQQMENLRSAGDIRLKPIKELFYQSNPTMIPMEYFEISKYLEAHIDSDGKFASIVQFCEHYLLEKTHQLTPSNSANISDRSSTKSMPHNHDSNPMTSSSGKLRTRSAPRNISSPATIPEMDPYAASLPGDHLHEHPYDLAEPERSAPLMNYKKMVFNHTNKSKSPSMSNNLRSRPPLKSAPSTKTSAKQNSGDQYGHMAMLSHDDEDEEELEESRSALQLHVHDRDAQNTPSTVNGQVTPILEADFQMIDHIYSNTVNNTSLNITAMDTNTSMGNAASNSTQLRVIQEINYNVDESGMVYMCDYDDDDDEDFNEDDDEVVSQRPPFRGSGPGQMSIATSTCSVRSNSDLPFRGRLMGGGSTSEVTLFD